MPQDILDAIAEGMDKEIIEAAEGILKSRVNPRGDRRGQ
jgi:hypothetical protein